MPMIEGTAYGVVLNDRAERDALAPAFRAPPYGAPPVAPVLYIKPRGTFAHNDAQVRVPTDVASLVVAATLALVIGADGRPAAARLAIDIGEPHATYFRPAVRERCRDGFLPLGEPGPVPTGTETIVTTISGREAHRWSLSRLVRPIPELLAEVGAFMTLAQGDLLLVGLAGDAARASVGDQIDVRCDGYPSLSATLVGDAA